jgi:hypothetical protein
VIRKATTREDIGVRFDWLSLSGERRVSMKNPPHPGRLVNNGIDALDLFVVKGEAAAALHS